MRKLQSQAVHHITLVGADRQTSIDFWEGVLGMPFIFDQPNLDRAEEGHPGQVHLADAIEKLVERSRETLSDDRSPKNPY